MEDNQLFDSLEINYPEFKERCILWMTKNWEKSTHKVVLEGFYILDGEPTTSFDLWRDATNMHQFRLNVVTPDEDEILLKQLSWIVEPWGSSSFHQVLQWRNELEFKCQESFFSIDSNSEALAKLFKENIYLNGKVNSDVWWSFVVGVAIHHFNSFQVVVEGGKNKVLLLKKAVSEQLELYLELKMSDIKGDLINNEINFPPIRIYFRRLVASASLNNRSEFKKNYLGLLGNPFIYPPCYPFKGYSAVTRVSVINGIYHFGHPKDFVDLLSKRAFYYTSLLKETTTMYLDYLSKSLIEVD